MRITAVMLAVMAFGTCVTAQENAESELSGTVLVSPANCFAVFDERATCKHDGACGHDHHDQGPKFNYAIELDGSHEILDLTATEDLSDLVPGQKIKVKGRHQGRGRFKVNNLTRGQKKKAGDTNGDTVLHAATSDEETSTSIAGEEAAAAGSVTSKTALVIRIIGADRSTTRSVAQLSDDVFGTAGDPVNMVERFAAMSYGQLMFSPATGVNIVDGVCEVTIPNTVVGADDSEIRSAAISAATDLLGDEPKNIADYVMVAIPPGTQGDWIAYAYLNSYLSVYNDQWASYVSGQVHEVGHNLGLYHANENGSYNDQQGYMGYSYSNDDGPVMGYNAAKNWQLGWYADQSLSIGQDEDWSGKVIGFANFGDAASDHRVIVKLECGTNDLYVTYNRKTGINSGTKEAGNMVTVVRQRDAGSSELLAKLSSGRAVTLGNPGNGESIVTIRFSGTGTDGSVQYANVEITWAPNTLPDVDAGPDQRVTYSSDPSFIDGLFFGEVSGNLNDWTANPRTMLLTDVASKTEDGIAGDTTEIFTGEIYDADGNISFTEDIDDKARIWIDGNLVISDDVHNARTSTGNLNLAPGWHQIEIRISNGGGGSGPKTSPGIGYDPNGGTAWQTITDPGDGSLLRVALSGGGAADLEGAASDADGDPVTTTWSKVSGPGAVYFGNAAALVTTAYFTQPGVYVLRLTANDGYAQNVDEVTIAVVEPMRAVTLMVSNAGSGLILFETSGSGSVVQDGDGQWTVTTPISLGSMADLVLEFLIGKNG